MAKNGFKVFNSDMHLVEPADLWSAPSTQPTKIAPKGPSRHPRDLGVQVAGHTFPAENRSYTHAITPIMTRQMDIYAESEALGGTASQVKAMDTEGIDLACCSPAGACSPWAPATWSRAWPRPSPGPTTTGWPISARAAPDACSGGDDPAHDIDGAIHEARRVVHELGFKTVFVRPNLVHGRNWHDPYYDPLWAEIEQLACP